MDVAITGQLQRAASRGRAARPAPASAEVCGDDGNMEVEEMETSQQQHLILVIRYKCILSTHSKSGPVPVLVGSCA